MYPDEGCDCETCNRDCSCDCHTVARFSIGLLVILTVTLGVLITCLYVDKRLDELEARTLDGPPVAQPGPPPAPR